MDMQINICNEKEKKIPEREYFVDKIGNNFNHK